MFQRRLTFAAPIGYFANGRFAFAVRSVAVLCAIGTAAFVGLNASVAAEGNAKAGTGSVSIDASLAFPITLPDTAPWRYVPDPAPLSAFGAVKQVALPSIKAGDDVESINLVPATKQAIATFKKGASGLHSEGSTALVCNFETGRVDARWESTSDAPMCVSPDGSRLLCRTLNNVNSEPNELRLYSLAGAKAAPFVVWQPYGQEHRDKVKWAAFIENEKIATLSEAGNLAVWEISDLLPVWTAPTGRSAVVALSGGRKTLALVSDSGIKLVNLADGRVVGVITSKITQPAAAAFSEDGKRLAVCSGRSSDRIRVWNLEDGRLERDFGLQTHRPFDSKGLVWADPARLLVGGTLLVDVERRVELWRFTNIDSKTSYAVNAGRLWFVNSGTLQSLAVPTTKSLEALGNLQPEQLVVLQPGSQVALEITGEGDANAAREAFTAQLAENEMTVVAQSPIRILCDMRTLPVQRVRVRNVNSPPPNNITEHEYTPRLGMLSIVVGNELVWQRTSHYSMAGFLDLKEGETVDQALARRTQADVMSLTTYELPKYLARIP